jgi:hypothetical protein
MINLALTMLPILVTFGVAAWNSPSDEVQPRSAMPGFPVEAACHNCPS